MGAKGRPAVAGLAHVVHHRYAIVVELDLSVRCLLCVDLLRVAVSVEKCRREFQGTKLVVVLCGDTAHQPERRNACDGRVQLSQRVVRAALVPAEDEAGLVLGW